MYYLAIDGKAAGPFSIDELTKKGIDNQSIVYTEEHGWVKATDIEELAAIIPKKIVPPPPPPIHLFSEAAHGSSLFQEEKVAFATTGNKLQIASQLKDKVWLILLIVFLGLAGFGFNYFQGIKEAERKEAEVRSQELRQQEEEARLAREQRIREIKAEIQRTENRIATLNSDLRSANTELVKAREWVFLRTAEEKAREIAACNQKIASIRNEIEQYSNRIVELNGMLE